MNAINYRVSLDMFDVSSQITIKAKKGDSACKIYITLAENGKIYKITDGCTATFSAKKADGNFVYHDCTIENNTIVYDFASSTDEEGDCQISACEGNVDCEVALFNNKGEQLTSPRFVLVVDGTVYNGEDINSSESIQGVKEVIDRANELVDEIETKLENGEFNGKDGEITNLDQTYSPQSENAQSGRAVAQAIDGSVPKTQLDAPGAPFSSVLAVNNYDPAANGNFPSDSAYKYIGVHDVDYNGKGVEDAYVYTGKIPIRDGKGNLWTGMPIDDSDCVPKKYVDDGFVKKVKGNGHTHQVYAVGDIYDEYKDITLVVEDNGQFESDFDYGQIPSRQANGNIMTNAPIKERDCVNKKYVDDIVGDIETLLGGI